MLNAADLFDPEILADLTGQAGEKGSQNNGTAPARYDYAPPVAEPEAGTLDDGGHYRQPPRAATGPVAPPFFNLASLPATGPQPAALPPPSFPPRARVPVSAPLPPLEEDEEEEEEESEEEGEEGGDWMPQRGYRIVSGPPPLGAPAGRAMMPAPLGMYPAGPFPMPASPASKRRPASPARKRRPFFSTLGGLVSLLVVLAIIGGALLFGASRYFQLQALQPKPAQTTLAILPTVAPKAGYTIYSDQTLAFSLQYVTSWQKQADHDKSDAQYRGDLFQAGGPNVGFEVGSAPQYGGLGPSQIDDYIIRQPFPISNIASIQASVPASPTIHILNQDWTAEDADVTLTTGVKLRLTCLALIHNGRGYAIFYFAPQEVFSNDYTQFFQPMLLSFRFLNG
jgi:hypothetical protein